MPDEYLPLLVFPEKRILQPERATVSLGETKFTRAMVQK